LLIGVVTSWVQYLPLIEFAYNNSYQATIGMPPYEALYGHKYQSPLYWDNISETQTLELELFQDTRDKVLVIRERMSAAQSRRRVMLIIEGALEFEVGDHVFLKISPMRGVMERKRSSRFIGPFKITQKVGRLAFRVALPTDLVGTHDVFHVSMFKKFLILTSSRWESVTYIEELVKIVDKKEQVLCSKMIPIVNVLWRNHGVEEAS
jgi:hypothetical protein